MGTRPTRPIRIRDALKQTRKIAVGQLIMQGRAHLVGVKALGRGLALYILRYADELREPSHYFEGITAEPDPQAVELAAELIERESGRFEPEKMPDQYAAAIRKRFRPRLKIVLPRWSSLRKASLRLPSSISWLR